MRKLWTVATLFTSQLVFTPLALAQNQQDVIYKKDGSILRGTLVEQDFENGSYKIQLDGGSIFAISKDEIIKISKVAPLNITAVASNGVNINIENNPTITQIPTQSLQQSPTLQTYDNSRGKTAEKRHSIRIGSMSKDITDSDDNGVSLAGINVAYQYNVDEHVAFYAEYNHADIDRLIIDGEHYKITADNYNQYDPYRKAYRGDLSYTGFEASAMLSTNNHQGWQFYTGLGVFKETFSSQNFTADDASGAVVTLGMGYSWQTVQLQLRVSGHGSSDYGNGLSSINTALQLGFNY